MTSAEVNPVRARLVDLSEKPVYVVRSLAIPALFPIRFGVRAVLQNSKFILRSPSCKDNMLRSRVQTADEDLMIDWPERNSGRPWTRYEHLPDRERGLDERSSLDRKCGLDGRSSFALELSRRCKFGFVLKLIRRC
jgi:hypothetical protein